MKLEIRNGENGLLRISIEGDAAAKYHDILLADKRFKKLKEARKDYYIFRVFNDFILPMGDLKLHLWSQDYIKIIE